jgi:hypothetical protein
MNGASLRCRGEHCASIRQNRRSVRENPAAALPIRFNLSIQGMMTPYHPVVWSKRHPRGRMNMPDRLGADYWRERAKEARDQASAMRDEKARRALLGITENYE